LFAVAWTEEHTLKSSLVVLIVLCLACKPAVEPAAPQPASRPDAPQPTVSAAQPDVAEPTVIEDEADAPAVGANSASSKKPPVNTPRPEIAITSVEVSNPVIVTGEARTFENSVVLRVRGADGKLLTEGFTTSNGEMGHHNPFRGTLWLTRNPGKSVTIEALEYSAKDGAEIHPSRVSRPYAVEPIAATLYFPDDKCTAVTPYVRRMPKSISMARLLLEALIAGPAPEEQRRGATTAFPQGSAVQSVNLRNGTLTVDFNDRLRNVGGSCRAQMIRASVTETLRRLPSVKKVVITAAGSEPLALQP
jgi:hypothetical protein